MKATGIVRRIDDLGRVVIPKEIRRSMGIREGDPLEIYTTREGEVIFKKYIPLGCIQEEAEKVYNSLKGMHIVCAIYDNCGNRVIGAKTLANSIDLDELAELEGKYVEVRQDGDVVAYIMADATITQEQKACVVMAAKLLGELLA
jgi:stage V sporulation protein T